MRFRLGPIPEDPTFDPEADGWTRLPEPGPGQLILAAVPLGMLLAVALALLWGPIVRFAPPVDASSVSITLPQLLAAPLVLAGFMSLHELSHVLPMVFAGSSRDVVIGFWPRFLAPYVAYTGALSREAQLLSGVTPFVLLTGLPFVVAWAVPALASWMAGLSILNALGSAADLIMLVLLIHRVPARGSIRNQGFSTWWRSAV